MIVLKTPQDKLLSAVQSVAGIIEKRNTIPVLSNVLIAKTGNMVQLTGSDLDIQIRTNVDLGGDPGDFTTTVNARKLIDILRTIASDQIVSLEAKDSKLIVRGGKSRFMLQTLPAADYPLVQESPNFGPSFEIPQKTLKRLLNQVAFSMALHDIRYYLNGILFVAEGQRLALVSTDGHRLSYTAATLDVEVPKQEVILPRKTVVELQHLLSDDGAPSHESLQPSIEMRFAANQARFTFGTMEFVTKLVEGKFPDYNRVIPKGYQITITLTRAPLLASLERTSILTSEKFKGVRMTFDNAILRVTSSNAEQEEALDELDINYEGEHIETGYNVLYLLDALRSMNSETVSFNMQDAKSSTLITLPDDPEFRYVVMPLQV